MPQWDMPLEQLERYRSDYQEPADFDAFWSRTLAETREHPLGLEIVPVDTPIRQLDVSDVTFAGFGGHPIRGWLIRPRTAGPLPVVVSFQGYGGGRGIPVEWTLFASAGYAQFVVDSRGQGSVHRTGATADPVGSAPHVPGFATRGIRNPDDSYYRRLFIDAARALEAAAELPGVDVGRIVSAGASQGGGMALAAAALTADLPSPAAAVLADVPFLQDIGRSIRIAGNGTASEIAAYLHAHRDALDDVRRTIGYIDGLAFAARLQIPALYSVGLMDDVCPPSTVFASFNRYAGPKRLVTYPFNGHEGGGPFQLTEQLNHLAELFG